MRHSWEASQLLCPGLEVSSSLSSSSSASSPESGSYTCVCVCVCRLEWCMSAALAICPCGHICVHPLFLCRVHLSEMSFYFESKLLSFYCVYKLSPPVNHSCRPLGVWFIHSSVGTSDMFEKLMSMLLMSWKLRWRSQQETGNSFKFALKRDRRAKLLETVSLPR